MLDAELLSEEELDEEEPNEEELDEEELNAKPPKPLEEAKVPSQLATSSTCDARAVSNTGKSGADHERERKEEALAQIDEYVRVDNAGVLTLAEPRLETARDLSANLVKFILGTIEELDSGRATTAKTAEAAISALFNGLSFVRPKPKRNGLRTRYASRGTNATIPGMPAFVKKARQLHKSFRSWIPANGSSM
ncbi:hypothetical protein LPJ74_006748, partial [Coemansia sp. RSA 1843]